MKTSFLPAGYTSLPFGYLKFEPNGYDGADKLPVIIHQHGTGECGPGTEESLKKLFNAGIPKEIKMGLELPAMVICPQQPCPGWMTKEGVKDVLDYVRSLPNVDLKRIYYTGYSAGSVATFNAVFFYPELITAAVGVAVKASPTPPNKASKGLPVYIISNKGDAPSELTGMETALQRAGVNLKKDIGESNAHNSWDRAYSDPKTYEWMFSQKKDVVLPPTPIEPIDVTLVYDHHIEQLEKSLSELKRLRDRGNIFTRK